MATTDQKVIIYDDTCPLCVWYTQQFVDNGLLANDGRMSFEQLSQEETYATQLAWPKSKHEIPLVDREGGQTIYGLDSLIYIIAYRFPFLKPVMTFAPIYAFFKFLYKIVSYNRRIIVAAPTKESTYDCTPDFNNFYRLLFIFIALIATYFIFTPFQTALFNSPVLGVYLTQNIVWYLLLFFLGIHLVGTYTLDYQKKVDVFGHLSVLLLIGGLFLIPFLVSFYFWESAWWLLIAGGLAAFCIMFREYRRRLQVMMA